MNPALPPELQERIHQKIHDYYQQRSYQFYMLLFGEIEHRILNKHIEMIRKYYERVTNTRD